MTRSALVTGGSRGIGHAIVAELERSGFTVTAPSRAELDLADQASVKAWTATHASRPWDVLVNNAGINELGRLGSLADDAFSAMLAINLEAPFALVQALLPGMCERRWGRIVNISSIWAVVGREARAGYAVTKSALHGLTRVAAVEGAPHQVLVNAVAPGYTATELTTKNNSAADLESIASRIPARRLAAPEEIARVVRWLCSDDNTYMTGQVLVADGGFSIV